MVTPFRYSRSREAMPGPGLRAVLIPPESFGAVLDTQIPTKIVTFGASGMKALTD